MITTHIAPPETVAATDGVQVIGGRFIETSVQFTPSVERHTSLVPMPLLWVLPPRNPDRVVDTSVWCSQRVPNAALAVSSRQVLPSLEDQTSDCGVCTVVGTGLPGRTGVAPPMTQ